METIKAGLIFELIPKIMGELGPIGKDKENKEQHFKYRSIDQFYNAANPLFAKHGIFTVPEIIEREAKEYTTKSGTIWEKTVLRIKYTAYANDGSSIWGTVSGAGSDPGDKGDNKAMAIGHKYFLMQVLCVATEDLEDPDEHIPEERVKPEPTEWEKLYNEFTALMTDLTQDLDTKGKQVAYADTVKRILKIDKAPISKYLNSAQLKALIDELKAGKN